MIAASPIRAVALTLLGVVFLAASPALAQVSKPKSTPRAARVSVDTVIAERPRQTVPVIGRLVAQRSGLVSVISKGVVAEVLVRVGDRVKTGDVMARLLDNSLTWAKALRTAEVNSAKARLANAKTQIGLRRQELQRLQNLRKSAAFSAARFEDAQKELAKSQSGAAGAEADLDRATANLKLAQIDLDNAQIKAPYGGVVSALHTEIGTYLNTGQPVFTLVDDANMEIEADVPARRTRALVPGTVVVFTTNSALDANDTDPKTARVRAVVPEENALTRTRTARFVPQPDATIIGAAANQSVTLLIPARADQTVVTVHKDAVLTKAQKQVVFVAEDGKVALRAVTLGEAVGTRFIVLNGLQPGEQVVVRGNERLATGQAIEINRQ